MSRDTYRKQHPLPASKISRGLLHAGVQREVFVEGMDHPVYAETYTVPEAAKALGRSMLSLKKWINDGIIPPPVLQDTSKGFKQYSAGELEVIRRHVALHEREFAYLTNKHDVTIHTIWQAMQAYRATHI